MGIVGTHPGSFRKSGKQRSWRHTELGRAYGERDVGEKSVEGRWIVEDVGPEITRRIAWK